MDFKIEFTNKEITPWDIIEAFIKDTLEKLSGKRISLLRTDSSFYDKAEAMYQSPLWDSPRRMIMVRQHFPARPKATRRMLKWFEDEGIYQNYRYSCFITNLELPAEIIWQTYRQRADSENRIKELKHNVGVDSFNLKSFYTTAAALSVALMAYNIVSLFRQVVLNTQVHEQMKTLRYKVFAIGGYITKNGNQRILRLSLAMKRREWFTGFWLNLNNIKSPPIFLF